jgi:WD40 repeat protein
MIEGPARRAGLRFEAGIVDRLIRDVNGDPWALPLLQFALVKLWEARPRDHVSITWDVYNRTFGEGGARDVLQASAAQFYERDLTENERVVARKVLVSLIRTSTGRDLGLTRLPYADFEGPRDLVDLPPPRAPERSRGRQQEVVRKEDREVVEKLRKAGLVRLRPGDDGRPVVELASEAILDKWPSLAGWVYEARRDADLASQRHRMLVAWVATLVVVFAVLSVLYSHFRSAKMLADSENQRAVQAMRAESEKQRADFQERVASARRLIDYSYAYRSIKLDLCLLFGLKAYDFADELDANDPRSKVRELLQGEARNALLFILNSYPRLDKFLLSGENSGPTSFVTQSPDGSALALAIKVEDAHYEIALWRRSASGSDFERVRFDDGEIAPGEKCPGPIYGLAFRPDGKVLASGGGRVVKPGKFQSQLILWDVAKRPMPVKLSEPPQPDPEGEILAVAFSPDGTKLATAGKGDPDSGKSEESSGIVRLWDVSRPDSPKLLGKSDHGPREPGKSAEKMLGLTFSRDGKMLVSGGGAGQKNENEDYRDGEIAVWDVDAFPDEKPDRLTLSRMDDKRPGRSYAVCGLALHQPDGGREGPQLLAAGCLDGTVALVDLSKAKPNPVFLPGSETSPSRHRGFVRSLAFSDNGKQLATGGDDTTVIVWDLSKWESPQAVGKPMQGHNGDIHSLVFENEGGYLKSAARDETWARWNLTTPNGLARRLGEPSGPVHSIAIHPSGTRLATASGHLGQAGSATEGGSIHLWDISKKQFLPIGSPIGHHGRVLDMAFSPDGEVLATGGDDKQILLWVFPKGGTVEADQAIMAPIKAAHDGKITCVQFQPAIVGRGRVLASASDDRSVKLWDVSEPGNPRLLSKLPRFPFPVASLGFSPDGQTLVTGHWEKIIRVWNVADPMNPHQICPPLIGHEDVVLCLAFSLDGSWLASGGKDSMVLIWQFKKDGQPVDPALFHEIWSHRRPVWSIAFSPDKNWLASASDDEGTNLHLWDTHELSQQHSVGPLLNGHVGTVSRVACFRAEDGTSRLVSAGQDGSILLWDLTPEKWIDHAREVANRDMKPEEQRTFLSEGQ